MPKIELVDVTNPADEGVNLALNMTLPRFEGFQLHLATKETD